MVSIQLTNSQMGFPYYNENGGALMKNYAQNSIGFSMSQRPNFGIFLQLQRAKKQNTTNIIKGYSENDIVHKKEFEFKPSFDEYLKAMESVKSGRAKQGRPLRSRKVKDSGKIVKENSSIIQEEDVVAEKKIVAVKQYKIKGSSKNGIINKKEEFKPFLDEHLKAMESMTIDRAKERPQSSWKVKGANSDFKKTDKIQAYNSRRIREEKIVAEKKIVAVEKKATNSEVLDVERVAFKALEEDDDVCDKPRVTRADMEDRIQKLAMCLNGADIDMPEWMFSKMMRNAKIRFSDHSMLRMIQILGKLGNWRRVLQVIEWIQSRERFKSHKMRYIYTAALDVLGKSRRPVEALNLFRAMQQNMSSYPDLVAYRCIAVNLGQAGHMKELFDVIDSMRSPPKKKFKAGVLAKWDPRLEPDIVVYNAVLNACVRRKKWEGAFWVLQQLKQQGQQPSSTTYGLIMEVMLACGKYNLVHEFFRKMQKSSIPNALTYKVLLNTLWREGKIDEAMLAVEDMERRGIVGTSGLYYDLARCLCSAGRCQEALMQVDKICKVANRPLVVTYTGLIQACLSSGDIVNGAYIFNHMQKVCSPNLVTCNIMLKAFLDHCMFEEAKQLFLQLLENARCISSKSDYKNKVIPDLHTFNLMLEACHAEQNWADLEFAYINMLNYGYHFNAKRHLRIILDACTAGKAGLLETTWEHLLQGDQIPPPLLIKEMFRIKLEQSDHKAALCCFACHPSINSQEFPTNWWLKFFAENTCCFDNDVLVKLMHAVDLLVARTDVQNEIIQNLKIACIKVLGKRTTSAALHLISPDSIILYETKDIC